MRGGADITPQGIGDLLRAIQPAGWGNPWASLAEYTVDDVPNLAQEVFRPDGGMSTVPDGPVRDTLLRLVEAAPLEDLRDAWAASGATREWALDLCARVEAELEADELDGAAFEWLMSRTLTSGIVLMAEMSDRRWSPADRASTSVGLLLMRQAFRDLDEKVPGCQWELLDSPGVIMPPPLLAFLQSGLTPSGVRSSFGDFAEPSA